jgi:hypothetical protein
MSLLSKQELLLDSLLKFYNDSKKKDIVMSVVKQNADISLRLLDWLVTNYSKKFNVHYELSATNKDGYIPSNKNFNLWIDYKNQLKAYSKKQFDPFCRRQRIFISAENKVSFVSDTEYSLYESYKDGLLTTVGQLNFFRWAITNRVVDYASKNLDLIESDMLSSADKRTTTKKKTKRSRTKAQDQAQAQEPSEETVEDQEPSVEIVGSKDKDKDPKDSKHTEKNASDIELELDQVSIKTSVKDIKNIVKTMLSQKETLTSTLNQTSNQTLTLPKRKLSKNNNIAKSQKLKIIVQFQ